MLVFADDGAGLESFATETAEAAKFEALVLNCCGELADVECGMSDADRDIPVRIRIQGN